MRICERFIFLKIKIKKKYRFNTLRFFDGLTKHKTISPNYIQIVLEIRDSELLVPLKIKRF